MRRLAILVLGLALILSACSDDPAGPSAPVWPEDVVFAPSLGIDLQAMTQTASGLYYQDLILGTQDPAAQEGSKVTVHYNGWLHNGTLFDSSISRNSPFVFTLGAQGAIQGFDEGIRGMRVGGKRRLVIPSELGYGRAGSPGAIPPHAVLVFEVQLVGIQ